MIKKNTRVVFVDDGNERSEEMVGGIPLSVGETMRVHQGTDVFEYVVEKKDIDCFLDGEDQIVNIVYTVRKN